MAILVGLLAGVTTLSFTHSDAFAVPANRGAGYEVILFNEPSRLWLGDYTIQQVGFGNKAWCIDPEYDVAPKLNIDYSTNLKVGVDAINKEIAENTAYPQRSANALDKLESDSLAWILGRRGDITGANPDPISAGAFKLLANYYFGRDWKGHKIDIYTMTDADVFTLPLENGQSILARAREFDKWGKQMAADYNLPLKTKVASKTVGEPGTASTIDFTIEAANGKGVPDTLIAFDAAKSTSGLNVSWASAPFNGDAKVTLTDAKGIAQVKFTTPADGNYKVHVAAIAPGETSLAVPPAGSGTQRALVLPAAQIMEVEESGNVPPTTTTSSSTSSTTTTVPVTVQTTSTTSTTKPPTSTTSTTKPTTTTTKKPTTTTTTKPTTTTSTTTTTKPPTTTTTTTSTTTTTTTAPTTTTTVPVTVQTTTTTTAPCCDTTTTTTTVAKPQVEVSQECPPLNSNKYPITTTIWDSRSGQNYLVTAKLGQQTVSPMATYVPASNTKPAHYMTKISLTAVGGEEVSIDVTGGYFGSNAESRKVTLSTNCSTTTTTTTIKVLPSLQPSAACPAVAGSKLFPVTIRINDTKADQAYTVKIGNVSTVATRDNNGYVAKLNVTSTEGATLTANVTGGAFGTTGATTSVKLPDQLQSDSHHGRSSWNHGCHRMRANRHWTICRESDHQ